MQLWKRGNLGFRSWGEFGPQRPESFRNFWDLVAVLVTQASLIDRRRLQSPRFPTKAWPRPQADSPAGGGGWCKRAAASRAGLGMCMCVVRVYVWKDEDMCSYRRHLFYLAEKPLPSTHWIRPPTARQTSSWSSSSSPRLFAYEFASVSAALLKSSSDFVASFHAFVSLKAKPLSPALTRLNALVAHKYASTFGSRSTTEVDEKNPHASIGGSEHTWKFAWPRLLVSTRWRGIRPGTCADQPKSALCPGYSYSRIGQRRETTAQTGSHVYIVCISSSRSIGHFSKKNLKSNQTSSGSKRTSFSLN